MANQPKREFAPGELADGTVLVGTPDEMRPRLELWKKQQAALARGDDPTVLDAVPDFYDYDDL